MLDSVSQHQINGKSGHVHIQLYALRAFSHSLLECWMHFVKAAVAFYSNVTTCRLCMYAHQEAIQFCRQFEELYGKSECVPNMHYMCHLRT